jgi:hypothetical protein
MRANEKCDDFKMNLMQSLNRIENNLDKESGSRKSGSHRPPDEKIRERIFSRHHHHSPRNFNKISHIISSTSPMKKHKGFGWMSYEDK